MLQISSCGEVGWHLRKLDAHGRVCPLALASACYVAQLDLRTSCATPDSNAANIRGIRLHKPLQILILVPVLCAAALHIIVDLILECMIHITQTHQPSFASWLNQN